MPADPHYKVILVGDCRVGKTSFLQNIVNSRVSHSQNLPPTIGVEYAPTKVQVRGQEIKINLWDTSGAEKYKSITSSYYRKCQGAIIIFDLTDRESFANLEKWIQDLDKFASPKLMKLVVGNKLDLVESGERSRQVKEEELVDFCMKHSLTFKYTSALTGYNIHESFLDFVEKIHEQAQNNQYVSHDMGSLSWENNPDISQLPVEGKVRLNDVDGSSSCPKCC